MSGEPAPYRRGDPEAQERRLRLRLLILSLALVAAAAFGVWHAQSKIPRSFVLASGVVDGSYHADAAAYARVLQRDGITVVERMTRGAGENAELLRDPKSGVQVAFLEGGVVPPDARDGIVMVAALRYEPVWVFYRGDETPHRLEDLRYKRIAMGNAGNGGRVIVGPMLEASNVTIANSKLVSMPSAAALKALQQGTIDVAIMVGATRSPVIWQALHDENVKLMSMDDAEPYARRFPFLTRLTLPAGTIDMSYRRIPAHDTTLVATKAMLAARSDFPGVLIAPLYDAARDLHSQQGFFEAAKEFPNTTPLDLPVSEDAGRHERFGASFLHRHLPFWLATLLEQLIVVVLPLLVVVVPLVNLLPRLLHWRARSRIYRWYGELKLLERDVERRQGKLPVESWLAHLERIERAAVRIRTSASVASEAYTLREHINLVRDAIGRRARQQDAARGEAPRAAAT
ncbi:MAG: TAXI family TRAP transporter solute-binding subunit [Burkholderiales bacterium]